MADRQEVEAVEAVVEKARWYGGVMANWQIERVAVDAIAALDRVRAERAEGEGVTVYTVEICPDCLRQEPHPHGKYRWQCQCGRLLFVDADEAAAKPHYRQTERIRVVVEDEVQRLRDERQAVLDCINLYGDEALHSALDAIGALSGDKENPQSDGAWSRSGDPSGETHLGPPGDKENPR